MLVSLAVGLSMDKKCKCVQGERGRERERFLQKRVLLLKSCKQITYVRHPEVKKTA